MMDVKDKTVPRLISQVVKNNPDAPAQYYKNASGDFECLSYAQMWQNAKDFAGGLLSYNVQRGERLGLISEDCKEWQQADLGLLSIGAIDIPRGTDASPSDLKYILSFTECRICIVETNAAAKKILDYVSPSENFDQAIAKMEGLCGGAAADTDRLRQVYKMLEAAGIAASFVLDPSITRGLDYYTGLVYETFLDELPTIGSICSGGRYDNLAGLYTKERIPGVGGSIGLDRLMAAMEQLGIAGKKGSYLDAEIFCQDDSLAIANQKAAADLRALGVNVEVFPEAKKMNQQYALAEAKSVVWGIFVAVDGKLTLKNLKTREQTEGLTAQEASKIILKNT